MSGTFVIAQGGGPTVVINQTLAGAVREIRKRHPGARILGARHGVRGVRDGQFADLSALEPAAIDRLAWTPGAALGSTRDKPDEHYCEAVLAGLKEASADAFIYIGGNDTAGTQGILAQASGGSIACVHAPKTIDNDLMETTIRRASSRRRSSSLARLPVSSSISGRCRASMSASSWAGTPAS